MPIAVCEDENSGDVSYHPATAQHPLSAVTSSPPAGQLPPAWPSLQQSPPWCVCLAWVARARRARGTPRLALASASVSLSGCSCVSVSATHASAIVSPIGCGCGGAGCSGRRGSRGHDHGSCHPPGREHGPCSRPGREPFRGSRHKQGSPRRLHRGRQGDSGPPQCWRAGKRVGAPRWGHT